MKRLARWLLNFAATVSLGLCIATMLLWAATRASMMGLRVYFGQTLVAIFVLDGRAGVAWTDVLYLGGRSNSSQSWFALHHDWHYWTHHDPAELHQMQRPKYGFGGFGYGFAIDPSIFQTGDPRKDLALREAAAGKIRSSTTRWAQLRLQIPNPREPRMLQAPLWFIAIILSLMPAKATIVLVRERKRVLDRCCPTCEYDLRATPDRCPECGTIPTLGKGARRIW